MRIIVCGSHKRGNRAAVFERLDYLVAMRPITFLAHGGADFIDSFAKQWAETRGIPNREYRAEWSKYGKAAGPIRNRVMFDAVKPDVVVAFPGDTGTANMVQIAERAGVSVWFPYGRESVGSGR